MSGGEGRVEAVRCAACRHFEDDPHVLERDIPGLITFSSGLAAVRDGDGLCALKQRYLSRASCCGEFAARR
ncbi:MAG TPA: hypothetical protein VLW26_05080 [Steroidobacteraceae bacterium]|nr:hypothetical protein [Steroidobacteraceae bacterium]